MPMETLKICYGVRLTVDEFLFLVPVPSSAAITDWWASTNRIPIGIEIKGQLMVIVGGEVSESRWRVYNRMYWELLEGVSNDWIMCADCNYSVSLQIPQPTIRTQNGKDRDIYTHILPYLVKDSFTIDIYFYVHVSSRDNCTETSGP